MGTYRDGRANTSANATTMDLSSDESKVNLKLCAPRDCKTKGEAWNDGRLHLLPRDAWCSLLAYHEGVPGELPNLQPQLRVSICQGITCVK
jgi:hypothetical protein